MAPPRHSAVAPAHLQDLHRVLEVADVEHRQLQPDVAKVAGAVGQALRTGRQAGRMPSRGARTGKLLCHARQHSASAAGQTRACFPCNQPQLATGYPS